MDYEKEYKSALERAKKLHKDAITLQLEQDIKDYEYIFPELKDSEDERIRGAIIEHLKDNDLIEWAAWLEKQGEQKQDPCEHCDDVKLNCYNFPCIKKKAFDQGKSALEAIKEEKVAWSEEDENKVTLFMQLTEGCNNEEELADWLKSLKERMKTRWKPSEEQMQALNTINVTGGISYAGQGQELIDLYNDLKKLREE